MTTPHTTFGLLEVQCPSDSGNHRVVKLADGMFAEDIELRRVDLRFGWDESERPFCGKCRSRIRPVDMGEGKVVWITGDGCEREPGCTGTIFEDTSLTDEEVVAQMFHEPDRSVASWCRGAAIHVDDDAGTLKLLARTEHDEVVVHLRRRANGGISVRTVQRRRRRRKEAA